MNTTPLCLPSPVPLLETALSLAVQLLIARHPDLLLPEDVPRIRSPPSLRGARAIVSLINVLFAELARYSALDAHGEPPALVHPASEPPATATDDIPF
jgi:hypothetical protein